MPWAIGAVLVATTAGSILLMAGALRIQRETDTEVRQHFENVLTLRRTQALLVDAETGQRGYLLTSNRSFLDPYLRASGEVPDKLRELVRTNVVPAGNPLERSSVAKLRELALTLRLADEGHKDTALALVAAGTGKGYMDAIRAETTKLVDIQQQELNSAIGRSERTARDTYAALAMLVFCAVVLLGLGLLTTLRMQRAEAESIRLREVEQAELRTRLIARELNHRVKNLFSIVLAIVQLAGRGSTTPKEAISRIRERVQALARAHEVSLGANPMTGFDLEAMLRTLLAPYSSPAAELELSGPPIQLPPMRVTPIGLIIHELATNAVKYGAWSADGGTVAVHWSVLAGRPHNGTPAADILRICWGEKGRQRPHVDGGIGFGSRLINAAVAQLDGSVSRERGDHGLSIIIDAPIISSELGEGERGPSDVQ